MTSPQLLSPPQSEHPPTAPLDSQSTQQPKLLIVTTIPATIESFLLPFAQHFRGQGWRVDALAQGAPQSQDCRDNFDQVWDVQWSRNPLDPRNLLSAAPALRRIVEGEGYDLVHVHTPVAAFVTRWALRGLRRRGAVKVVYTAHGFHFHGQGGWLKNWLYSQLEGLAGPWTDRLVVINREDQQAAYQKHLVDNGVGQGNRLVYMPGIGVDLEEYSGDLLPSEAVSALYASLNLPETTPLALCIGELIPRKRPADVLHSFALANCPQAHLLMAGDGPLRSRLEILAQQLQIQDRVHFLGNRRDIPCLLKAARVVLLASQQEGLPRCVLEAMAQGKPVIGSRIRGTADLLAGGGGVLVALGDLPTFAAALRDLLNAPAMAMALGQQGRQLVGAYALQTIIAQHDQLYRELLPAPLDPAPSQALDQAADRSPGLAPLTALAFAFKSGFDRLVAALALAVFAPVMVLVALAIYATMGGPVLFTQPRPGKDGRIFSLYKFRTMVPGDETAPDVHRITPLGDWLRRLSLDELPQLLNVVRGDMSIIGPRPLMVSYLPRYSPEQARRHSVKPGITGLAQVSGRNSISWDEKFRLDLQYIDHWSLGLDLKVIYLTGLKVLGQADINQDGAAVETMPDFWGTMAPGSAPGPESAAPSA